ncbi:MAG: DNA recombination/repair protein RecA, partial [Eubacterium sp.]|nr:DNA recombination/repair protein RecA [Eubacterium sp.]
TLKKSGEMICNRTRVKVVMNKVAPPVREAEFDIMFGRGISRSGDILDLAADKNIIVKSGAWYSYEGEKIGQGRENAKIYLEENSDFMQMIEGKVRAAYGLQGAPEEPETEAEPAEEKEMSAMSSAPEL